METKLNIRRISELTLKQEQFFKEKYGEALYNQHIEHDCLVEIVTSEDVIPFIGTFSSRLREATKLDMEKGLIENKGG